MPNTTGLAYITLLQARNGLEELIKVEQYLIDQGITSDPGKNADNIFFYEQEIDKVEKLMG